MRLSLDQLPPHLRAQALAQLGAAAPAAAPAADPARAPAPASAPTHVAPVTKPAAKGKPRGRVCYEDGFRFASETERRVYRRLRDEIRASGDSDLRLYLQARFPLWSLAPAPDGKPRYITVDFAIVRGTQLIRVVDAKPKNRHARSRDWARGKAAFDRAYEPVAIDEST
jgi:hypothetical protein